MYSLVPHACVAIIVLVNVLAISRYSADEYVGLVSCTYPIINLEYVLVDRNSFLWIIQIGPEIPENIVSLRALRTNQGRNNKKKIGSMWLRLRLYRAIYVAVPTLKPKCLFMGIFVSVCTGNCDSENLWCSQWRKCCRNCWFSNLGGGFWGTEE